MNTFDILHFEHQSILDVLGVVHRQLLRVKIAGAMALLADAGLADFFSCFVARCHHQKEFELFAKLMHHEQAMLIAPIAGLYNDQSYLNRLSATLTDKWAQLQAGETELAGEAAILFLDYAQQLKNQIEKEERFFLVVGDLLEPEEQAALHALFTDLDQAVLGDGGHTRYCAWVRSFTGAPQ